MPSLCWCTQWHAGCSTSHHPHCHLCQGLTQADHPLQLGKRDCVLQNHHHCNITAQSSSSVLKHAWQHSYLTIKCSMFVYANTHYTTPLEIKFLYLGHRENHCSLKTCCIIYVLIYKKISYFCLKIFQNNTHLFHRPYPNFNTKAVTWRLRSGSYKQQIINICTVTTFSSLLVYSSSNISYKHQQMHSYIIKSPLY